MFRSVSDANDIALVEKTMDEVNPTVAIYKNCCDTLYHGSFYMLLRDEKTEAKKVEESEKKQLTGGCEVGILIKLSQESGGRKRKFALGRTLKEIEKVLDSKA